MLSPSALLQRRQLRIRDITSGIDACATADSICNPVAAFVAQLAVAATAEFVA